MQTVLVYFYKIPICNLVGAHVMLKLKWQWYASNLYTTLSNHSTLGTPLVYFSTIFYMYPVIIQKSFNI